MYTQESNPEFQGENNNPQNVFFKKDEDENHNEDDIIDMMFPNDREEWDNE